MAVLYKTIEFHRFGSSEGLLKPENQYIRTSGWDAVATQVSPALDHREFLLDLQTLRYIAEVSDADVLAAQDRLAAEAVRFLPTSDPGAGELLQIDLVTNAAELWALPFEACYAKHATWLQSAGEGVVLTRRIRGDFSEATTAWPATPRILFAHAPVNDDDFEQALVDEHVDALKRALEPWSRGKGIDDKLARVREITSASDLAELTREYKPTFVHLLAHGTEIPGELRLREDETWGLRLGPKRHRGTRPSDLANALRPVDGLPLVVTVAACDSGNAVSILAKQSVVQELHRCGVPVVVGSQFPLTMAGSTVLVSAFYAQLLEGADVRVALHAARVALKADESAGHDWLSLVGYVRLPPEGYAEHLQLVGLRMELRLLETVQARADALAEKGDPATQAIAFKEVERLMRHRLASLKNRRQQFGRRRDLIDEGAGLEASANKRLAELLFVRGRDLPADQARDWRESQDALMVAHECYGKAYKGNLQAHWLGMQMLALDVVLTGAAVNPMDWLLVVRAAEVERDAGDYWACGTLVEAALIAPHAGRPRDLAPARAMAEMLVSRARQAGDEFAITSTRRQIARYVHWWTTEHGFFAGGSDLSADASAVLKVIDELA